LFGYLVCLFDWFRTLIYPVIFTFDAVEPESGTASVCLYRSIPM